MEKYVSSDTLCDLAEVVLKNNFLKFFFCSMNFFCSKKTIIWKVSEFIKNEVESFINANAGNDGDDVDDKQYNHWI